MTPSSRACCEAHPGETTLTFSQSPYAIRCEWGAAGIEALLPGSDAVIIVDVLSFSTAVTVAVGRGAAVYPYRGPAEDAPAFAAARDATLASKGRAGGYSLSPASLTDIPAGTRLVLPSLNGSTLSLLTGGVPTLAGCLRNARAVATAASTFGSRVAVIPAGERWFVGREAGTLRPAVEDWLGAGAIIHHLAGTRSPEAALAEAAFLQARDALGDMLHGCSSGRELIAGGFAADVALAAALDADTVAPLLHADGAYLPFAG